MTEVGERPADDEGEEREHEQQHHRIGNRHHFGRRYVSTLVISESAVGDAINAFTMFDVWGTVAGTLGATLSGNLKLAYEAWLRGAMQKPSELAELIGLLQERPPMTAVEIGTARGGTVYVWCEVADPRATIVSIDLPGGSFGSGYSEAEIPAPDAYGKPQQELRFLLADSHDPATRAELQQILRGSSIDFLMIDGDHSYDGVKRDFELYSPLVAEDGLIAFHDIAPHSTAAGCEVQRFWTELRQSHSHLEFVDPVSESDLAAGWGGIGVIRWHQPELS